MLPCKALRLVPGLIVFGMTSLIRSGLKEMARRWYTPTETMYERLHKRYPDGQFIHRWKDLPDWQEPTSWQK